MSIFSLIIFVLILFVLVIIHEAGHFIFAKLSKMRVDEFAFGFPPRLASFKKGETTYAFNAIPLGGYVKIFGENGLTDEEKEKYKKESSESLKGSFESKNFFLKILTLSGGVLFNILAAVLFFTISFYSSDTKTLTPQEVLGVDYTQRNLVVAGLHEKSNLKIQGLREGDRIVSVSIPEDGFVLDKNNLSAQSLTDLVSKNQNKLIQMEVLGVEGETGKSFSAVPQAGIINDRKALGVSMVDVARTSPGFLESVHSGFSATFFYTQYIGSEIVKIFKGATVGESKLQDSLSGPIGLAHASKNLSERTLAEVANFTAMLSLSLAVFNILPIPALDGGRILFLVIDQLYFLVRGRKIGGKVEQVVHASGFVVLLMLMVFVTYFDILKLL